MDDNKDVVSICCLCGDSIPAKAQNPDDALSMDHVPPKQFYQKEVRETQDVNLWVVPTHKRCNEGYRKDEEYFYHAACAIVLDRNWQTGQVCYRDLKRRTDKPQTPAMLRNLLKTRTRITDGGLHLPPGIEQVDFDLSRLQCVAMKIAQGLFYRDQGRYLPQQNCEDLRLCLGESEVPELYQFPWQRAETKASVPEVFWYRRFEFDNLHLFSMRFWETFTFCAAFKSPCPVSPPAAKLGSAPRRVGRENPGVTIPPGQVCSSVRSD